MHSTGGKLRFDQSEGSAAAGSSGNSGRICHMHSCVASENANTYQLAWRHARMFSRYCCLLCRCCSCVRSALAAPLQLAGAARLADCGVYAQPGAASGPRCNPFAVAAGPALPSAADAGPRCCCCCRCCTLHAWPFASGASVSDAPASAEMAAAVAASQLSAASSLPALPRSTVATT